MKRRILMVGLSLALWSRAHAGLYYDGTGGIIPDGSTAGRTWQISSADVGNISSVSVVLNLSGGFNGDLYGYLTYKSGDSSATAILINHLGGGTSAASGSGLGTGLATLDYDGLLENGIRLVDGAAVSIGDVSPGAGNPVAVGSYGPTGPNSLNLTFGNMKAGGTWTLFFADTSAGDQSTLVSWGLDLGVSAVPEPVNAALGIFGAALLAGTLGRRLVNRGSRNERR